MARGRPPAALLLAGLGAARGCSVTAPCAPAVVLVTTFDGEYRPWRERLPLDVELPFDAAAPSAPATLGWNAELRVLGLVTGEGPRSSALTVTALGHDGRFDLRRARWLVAGIAGFDPAAASAGSAAWARYLVDGDLARFVDPREAPRGWPTGFSPRERTAPYGLPPPRTSEKAGVVYALSPSLVDWAFAVSSKVQLPDSDALRRIRAPYAGAFPEGAGRPPRVLYGDGVSTNIWWVGELSTEWARNWTSYWTEGRGAFAHSAMEDTGVAMALAALARGGRAARPEEALLVLRSASNFVMPPPGEAPGVFEMPFDEAAGCDAAYAAGAPVVRALAALPGEAPGAGAPPALMLLTA